MMEMTFLSSNLRFANFLIAKINFLSTSSSLFVRLISNYDLTERERSHLDADAVAVAVDIAAAAAVVVEELSQSKTEWGEKKKKQMKTFRNVAIYYILCSRKKTNLIKSS